MTTTTKPTKFYAVNHDNQQCYELGAGDWSALKPSSDILELYQQVSAIHRKVVENDKSLFNWKSLHETWASELAALFPFQVVSEHAFNDPQDEKASPYTLVGGTRTNVPIMTTLWMRHLRAETRSLLFGARYGTSAASIQAGAGLFNKGQK